MSSLLQIGQVVRGYASTYSIIKELHRAADQGAVYLALDTKLEKCVVKSIRGHWRLRNEADILEKYQARTPFIRPVIDEIESPKDPASIVLKHLDSQLLFESAKKRLSRPEIKQAAKSVLEALCLLHQDGMVHADIKLDNIFVNLSPSCQRFATIQLGDCGGVVHKDSKFAKEGHLIGASFTQSPEVKLGLPWGQSTDIWSFGTAILALVYGGNFFVFNPAHAGIKPDHPHYELEVLKRMYRSFGPFPESYQEIADDNAKLAIEVVSFEGPPERPFERITRREVPPADRDFILKIMKLDPRDRPTAQQLLEDEWFTEESEDTRDPL